MTPETLDLDALEREPLSGLQRWQLLALIEAARERDAANESANAAHKLVGQYQNRVARAELDRDCAQESREGQARNTAATIVERDQALSELATLRAQLAQAREALEPFGCKCESVCRDHLQISYCKKARARKIVATLTAALGDQPLAPASTEDGK